MASSALAACGDDEKGSDRATHDEWFAAACEVLAEADPGFDAFFAAHPEPTLADWAEFLPHAIEELNKLEVVADLSHPIELDAPLAAAVAAVHKLQDTWQASVDAANAGDQATFDELEEQAQGVDVPAMEDALHAAEPRDCSELSS
ncbi:MAG: hypothetical protein HY826_08115 [Actinobacteria bacterium]|nr:hypothetical protein [Actinomycetota bacterium]